ncbi:MAG: hypothetical protein ABII18_08935 [bacterium]|nr:hypothetical protein [bacterium]MBU1919017.1 hypothetical protein [bacterium]
MTDILETTDKEFNNYIPQEPKKNKSGCGCLAIGFFALILLFLLPIIGGGIYLYTLDDADIGSLVVKVAKHPSFVEGFKEEIMTNKELPENQKVMLLGIYDNFLAKYDSLSPDKKEKVNKNIFIVLKKLLTEADKYDKAPPPEFVELIAILSMDDDFINIVNKMEEQVKKIEEMQKTGELPETLTQNPASKTTSSIGQDSEPETTTLPEPEPIDNTTTEDYDF